MYKKLYFTGISIYAILLVFSLHFSAERILFLDMASAFFNILVHNGFIMGHYRFGDLISQFFPIFAMKLGLSLPAIIYFYSAGFIIYSLAAYIICGSILKRYDFALVILLQNLLFAADTFYMISPLSQSVTMLMVLFAMIAGKQLNSFNPLTLALVFAILVTVVFFHPLSLFVMAFSVVFFGFEKGKSTDRKLLYTLAITYFVVMAVKFIAFRSAYEGHSMSGLKNFVTQFPNYINLYSNKRFLQNCLTKYYWIPVLFAVITGLYIKIKDRTKLWLFLVSFSGYFALVNICYPTSETPQFYMENLYIPLNIFLLLPVVFDLMPALQNKWALPLVLVICASGLLRIYNTHTFYTARLNYERKILDKYGEKKVIIDSAKTDPAMLTNLWANPYEFVLLSESEKGKPASIIIDANPRKLEWAGGLKNGLLVNWNVYPYKDLPKRFFHFTDSVTGYVIEK